MIYLLRIEGNADMHALRAVLKALLRRHGFRCVELREQPMEKMHGKQTAGRPDSRSAAGSRARTRIAQGIS
jgi:hypothetical protein